MGSFNIKLKKSTYERIEKLRSRHENHNAVINRAMDALDPIAKSSQSLDEREVNSRHWRQLLETMFDVVIEKSGGKSGVLVSGDQSNLELGQVKTRGFKPIDELNISARYKSANKSCDALVAIARSFGIELDVTFSWPFSEKCKYSGKTARFRVPGEPP
ncbi:MAG: hypothetical protein OXG88_07680 [Gammaproteobacteria bacterium]|nr:hypothetical protein [Gammaproteobacteria bacterium]